MLLITRTILQNPKCCCAYILRKRTAMCYMLTDNKLFSQSNIPSLWNYRTKSLLWNHRKKGWLWNSTKKLSSFDDSTENKSPVTVMESVVYKMPPGIQPYLRLMRFDKPTGTFLLLWPCYWSLAFAAAPGCFPDPVLLAQFGLGALLMRGAGCTINDLWDKDIDAKVARTKNRPLASGEISVLDAYMFLGGQLSLALLILLQFNWYSIVLGASSLSLVVLYPLVKRVWSWPQLVLGFTFNWGALLGWSAVHGYCHWPIVLPLYGACISWTLIYDTIYAHQDKVDDVLIKIKSTALKFGDKTKTWLSCFSCSAVACLMGCGYMADQTWPYYVSIAVTSSMFAYQISSLDINSPTNCWQKFKSNQKIGWIIFVGIVGGTLLQSSETNKRKETRTLPKESYLNSSTLHLS